MNQKPQKTKPRPYKFKKKPSRQTQPRQSITILFYKPFQVLCQFTTQDDKKTLADWIDIPDIYPAGRLDYDSEGLLLLTNDGKIQHEISHPTKKLFKTYAVQVEGIPTETQLEMLRQGVELKDGMTLPAEIKVFEDQNLFPPRNPPIRFRKNCPETWVQIKICEGKNRQVRRMTAAVGLPTLRLIRTHIGPYSIDGLNPGDFKKLVYTQRV